MPTHPFPPLQGKLEFITIDSQALRGNLLGDPSVRQVAVYQTRGVDEANPAPLLVSLAGFTSSGLKQLNWVLFEENLLQRVDRLVEAGELAPSVFALPDCFTRLGGNQYVDTPILGNWEQFLVQEMVPAIEQAFPVRSGPRHRAIFGKSSGGYGALIQGLKHGEQWGALACHSGDIGFDIAFRRDLPVVLQTLARFDCDVTRFVEHFEQTEKVEGDLLYGMMFLAFAASYDPAPKGPFGVQLPMDPRSCDVIPERWEQWLAADPLVMLERSDCQEQLGKVGKIFIDCGFRDQYQLHYGARSFCDRLEELKIPHVFEEFDGTHSGIDHRLDHSLPVLRGAID